MKQLILISFLFIFVLPSYAREVPSLPKGLNIDALNGTSVRLDDFRGGVVVVQFWASWCGPCEKQMSVLDDIKQNYVAKDLTIISISLDDDQKAAKSFLKARREKTGKNMGHPVLLDQQRQAARQFKVETMPATYLIDRDGNIVEAFKGYWPAQQAELQRAIEKLVNAQDSAASQAAENSRAPGSAT